MRHLTIREVPDDLAKALQREKRRRGKSLNQTVKELLRQSLALDAEAVPGNGLGRLAGGWSEQDLESFERATAVFERIDEDLWK
jgi:plasmid stability protein